MAESQPCDFMRNHAPVSLFLWHRQGQFTTLLLYGIAGDAVAAFAPDGGRLGFIPLKFSCSSAATVGHKPAPQNFHFKEDASCSCSTAALTVCFVGLVAATDTRTSIHAMNHIICKLGQSIFSLKLEILFQCVRRRHSQPFRSLT